MSKVEDFLTIEEEQDIIVAINEAENETSGEIRVHIENCSNRNCLERAEEVFYYLGMEKTKDKNAVLFYVATDDKKFAVVGDEGINNVVPDDFWDSIKNRVTTEFAKENHLDGLVLGIIEAGLKLKEFFPYQEDDEDELPNEVSRG